MLKQKKLIIGFGVTGLGIAGALFSYLEFTNYRPLRPALLGAAIIFCPLSLLSVFFLDIEPHTAEEVLGWFVIGLINSALYGAIGALVGKHLWKSGSPTT
jgi:hypothetical protein